MASPTTPRATTISPTLLALKPFFPHEPKSLSGIALRAFLLGVTLALSLVATLYLLLAAPSPAWRIAFFIAALSLFHFLEFWTTAARNTLTASVDSFLLTANWPSYAIAHSAALVECCVACAFFPERAWGPGYLSVPLGLVLVAVGQGVRSAAMMQAGASFNHHVQTQKADSHTLVTGGLYAVLRHPSYFGFFYWGLGTQLVMGNVVCFAAYAGVLWLFFSTRIKHEEGKLVEFFKQDYVEYRKRVWTWIPFIR